MTKNMLSWEMIEILQDADLMQASIKRNKHTAYPLPPTTSEEEIAKWQKT